MEKIQETPPQEKPTTTTITQELEISPAVEPPTNPVSEESPKDVVSCCKPAITPDRLKVPKAFKYPER